MNKKDKVRLSKKMSYALRHRPDVFDLTLGEGGWVKTIDLARAMGVTTHYIMEVVNDPDADKVRFSVKGAHGPEFIRAAQGHSVDVDLKLVPIEPPDMLFHGTYVGALDAIFDGGLKKMSRTHVHLSETTEAAIEVGARRGKPVLIQVNALQAHTWGIKFYRADNGVWLSDDIPAKFLTATHP